MRDGEEECEGERERERTLPFYDWGHDFFIHSLCSNITALGLHERKSNSKYIEASSSIASDI